MSVEEKASLSSTKQKTSASPEEERENKRLKGTIAK